MRCLSIRQPWAWLICAGKKTIENRVWQTPYRGTIAIHASTTKSEVSRLRKSLESDAFSQSDFEYGAIIGFADIVDIQPYGREHEEDGFACGPYCFRLANGRFLREPVPMMGKLNLFVLDEAIAAKIENAETYQVDLQSDSRDARIANAFVFEADPVARYGETIEELRGKLDNEVLYAMCTRMIELEPTSVHGYLTRVILALDTGFAQTLKEDADKMLELDPKDLDAVAFGSDAYMVLEDFVRAGELSERLIEAHPTVYGFLVPYGRSLFELGRIPEAKQHLTRAIEELKDEQALQAHANLTLARIAIKEERLQDAADFVRRAVYLGISGPERHCVEARLAVSNGDTSKAKSELSKALALSPNHAEATRLATKLL